MDKERDENIKKTVLRKKTVLQKKASGMRHELKYQINHGDAHLVAGRLRKLFAYDKHAGTDGCYRVNSLYFDSPWDRALRQKIDGVNCREKFRIRYYNKDTSFIRLEKKMKNNGLCAKESVRITKEQVQLLLDGEYSFLLESEHPLMIELYSKMKGQLLRPRTIVCYDREAFLYEPGNVRITIDRNVRSGIGNLDFLNPDVCHVGVSDGSAILEVKYDAFLPELVRMAVQIPNRRASAYSKYAVCRRYD